MAEKRISTVKKRQGSNSKVRRGKERSEQAEASEDFRPSLAQRFADLDPEPLAVGRYLEIHPGVCFGKLTFKGTRLPVQNILYYLSKYQSIEKILETWPSLEREAVEEAIRLAVVAWPELMQEPIDAAIERLAETILQRDSAHAAATDEPNPAG